MGEVICTITYQELVEYVRSKYHPQQLSLFETEVAS